MSKYTTELRYICERLAGLDESEGYADVNYIIETAQPEIFDFNYPIFDESYRRPLELNILRHFYTREIGCETYGLWKLRLQAKLNEIMPYYNKIYTGYMSIVNPLHDTDLTTTHERSATEEGKTTDNKSGTDNLTANDIQNEDKTVTDENETTQSGSTNNQTTSEAHNNKTEKDLYSDTPQGSLDGILADEYLTNARQKEGNETDTRTDTGTATNNNESKGTNTQTTVGETTAKKTEDRYWEEENNGNRTVTTVENYVTHVAGKAGGQTFGVVLAEIIEKMVNVDEMLLWALEPLFMGVY